MKKSLPVNPVKKAAAQSSIAVEFSAGVQRQIRQHARTSMSAEICGVLIGSEENGVVAIENAIAGEGAREAGTHVTFTQETWAHVYQVKDARYPEKRIVGWYHSHPGFGVFLSEHDLFIHKNFFSGTGQIAWVFDPHTDEEGCFVWQDGEIVRLNRLTLREGGGSDVIAATDGASAQKRAKGANGDTAPRHLAEPGSPAPSGNSMRWGILTLTHIVALALGFLLGSLLAPPLIVISPHDAEMLMKERKK